MKREKKPTKLTVRKEVLARISGAAWHRTTFRCHESFYTYCCTMADCTYHPFC